MVVGLVKIFMPLTNVHQNLTKSFQSSVLVLLYINWMLFHYYFESADLWAYGVWVEVHKILPGIHSRICIGSCQWPRLERSYLRCDTAGPRTSSDLQRIYKRNCEATLSQNNA